jgi:flagellar hook-basal body complex protein FliE
MNSIDVNQVLSQIRALSAQAAAKPIAPPLAANAPVASSGFGDVLKGALTSVNTSQNDANRLQKAFELGDPNTDLASVMLATSKAQVSFKATVEVRNRLVSAYQDIMNMPI